MDLSKSFLLSKTIWGLVVTCVGTLLPVLVPGISTADVASFGQHVGLVVQDLMVYGGLVWAAYGRFVADTKLHVVLPAK